MYNRDTRCPNISNHDMFSSRSDTILALRSILHISKDTVFDSSNNSHTYIHTYIHVIPTTKPSPPLSPLSTLPPLTNQTPQNLPHKPQHPPFHHHQKCASNGNSASPHAAAGVPPTDAPNASTRRHTKPWEAGPSHRAMPSGGAFSTSPRDARSARRETGRWRRQGTRRGTRCGRGHGDGDEDFVVLDSD